MNKYLKEPSNYDKKPFVQLSEDFECWAGWYKIMEVINAKINHQNKSRTVITVDCYQGVLKNDIISAFKKSLSSTIFYSEELMISAEGVDDLVFPHVTDDAVFGYLTSLNLNHFFDPEKLKETRNKISKENSEIIIVFGAGASIVYPNPDVFIFFDMPRWEIQQRFRNNLIPNLGVQNEDLKTSLQYKRSYFVDWRVLDKHKKKGIEKWDFVIDTTIPENPKMLTGDSLRSGLDKLVSQPFRMVPFFDPGPWGGQWMKEYLDLDKKEMNFAWGFDCVPEENSIFFKVGNELFETPGINLLFYSSKRLLGEAVQARFGNEFPIRFDFLDTMEGGNLSLQVHPTVQYIQQEFGMHYTQDESYYILDAGEDANVYLGLKENVSLNEMKQDLIKSQKTGDFDAEKYVNKWKAKKHDHFLIPAGTIHCSGKNTVVLEISATPYIFTFKLWDWNRLGLDGKPRPINVERGFDVLDQDRTTSNVKNELINNLKVISNEEGVKEEKTGLHFSQFIETRRHWFKNKVTHKTNGSVNVLNLVSGKEAIVESPYNTFDPFVVHFAETFIIPENVKEYSISPFGLSEGEGCATVKAYVRI